MTIPPQDLPAIAARAKARMSARAARYAAARSAKTRAGAPKRRKGPAQRARKPNRVVLDATATPPVLGPLGVEVVDAIHAHEDRFDTAPTWESLAAMVGIKTQTLRDRAEHLRLAGVLTWKPGVPRSIAVVGRYREAA